MNKRQDLMVGILLIVFAVGLMLYSLNISFFGPNFFRLAITAVLFFVAIMNISPLSFPGLIMPLTVAFLINAESFGLYPNTFLTLISGLLLSLGLNIIFKKKTIIKVDFEKENIFMPNGQFNIQNNFKKNKTYLSGNNLYYGYIESNFSNSEIIFDPQSFSPDPIKIVLNVNFSKLTLHLPKEVRLIDQTQRIFAGSNESTSTSDIYTHFIEIQGDVNFAKIDIQYF